MNLRLLGVSFAGRRTAAQPLSELLEVGLAGLALQHRKTQTLERFVVIRHTLASFPRSDCTQSANNLRRR
jgi:hypothetical protein